MFAPAVGLCYCLILRLGWQLAIDFFCEDSVHKSGRDVSYDDDDDDDDAIKSISMSLSQG